MAMISAIIQSIVYEKILFSIPLIRITKRLSKVNVFQNFDCLVEIAHIFDG